MQTHAMPQVHGQVADRRQDPDLPSRKSCTRRAEVDDTEQCPVCFEDYSEAGEKEPRLGHSVVRHRKILFSMG